MKKKPKQTPKNLTRRESALLDHIRAGKTIVMLRVKRDFRRSGLGKLALKRSKTFKGKCPRSSTS
jgi:hypothetical protein